MQSTRRIARVVIDIVPSSSDARFRNTSVLALLPDPNQFRVMTAAASLIHGKLRARAKPSAVLTAPSLSLGPSRLVQAATDALIRGTTNAKRGIIRPTKLRAGQHGGLLEGESTQR